MTQEKTVVDGVLGDASDSCENGRASSNSIFYERQLSRGVSLN
jgi:hypothetical protein